MANDSRARKTDVYLAEVMTLVNTFRTQQRFLADGRNDLEFVGGALVRAFEHLPEQQPVLEELRELGVLTKQECGYCGCREDSEDGDRGWPCCPHCQGV